MLACIRKSHQTEPTDELERIEKWTQEHFQVKLSNLLAESPLKSTLLNKNQVENLINQYSQTIGDVEQTLPGEDTKLDEYLYK